MLLEPPIDALIKKVGNPYKLAVIVGKRARYLSRVMTEEEKNACPEVTTAVNEVYSGRVVEGDK